ncbi:MAG: Fic family protein [Luteolibacter sp.]|uniref:Fic family protein n=1 Tax=Luteolibacter sp. TaxID=1962973 RepID=UPI003264D428
MPLQIPTKEFDNLLRIIAGKASGASVKELLAEPALGFPKRTLQRRLDQLVSERRLKPAGKGRARRYLAPEEEPLPRTLVVREDTPVYKTRHEWLSPEALEIRAIIQRPLAQRNPVNYQGSFLEAYQPNKTYYLPEGLRKELAEIGQVGMSDLPAGTYFRQVMDRLLIDLSWNSSRLEGNTYSLLETQRLLELGEDAEGKAVQETQMILNHKAAIEMLADDAGELAFNRYTICNLHALLSDNLLSDPGACGRLRSLRVGISGTVFHPLGSPQQIEERFEQILEKATAIRDPLEQAFFSMVHLPYLQPFEDVNKRVSRLAANIPLVRHNLCPLSFVDVESYEYIGGLLGVYELNRIEYLRDVFVRAYRRSCARYSNVRQTLGDPDQFRLRHRADIAKFVREVVLGGMDKRVAAKWIAANAAGMVPLAERAKFIEVVETELGCLHGGNIARYRLRPSEFDAWIKDWK